MSVINRHGEVHLSCDECGETSDAADAADFQHMVDSAKAAGWKITQRGGIWSHHCPDCDGPVDRVELAKRKFGLK